MKNKNNKQSFTDNEEDFDINNMTNEPVVENDQETDVVDEDANMAEDLEEKFNELNDSFLRLHAEYDNYRKRSMKEKADLIKSGGEKAIVGVLPIVDDFERALNNIPDDAKEGFELIYNKFKNYLTQNGVKVINPIGEPFDIDLHEAITTIPAQDLSQKDKVVDCVEKGYMLGDKVIRYAKVIVAK